MIFQVWFNLSRPYRKRKFFKNSIRKAELQAYNEEFKKHQLGEMRSGMRQQYQWLKERVEQAKRGKLALLYEFYQENGDTISIMDLPLAPEEAENLPSELKAPNRFYKQDKEIADEDKENVKKRVEELKCIIEQREPDLAHQKKNIEGLDAAMVQTDQGIAGLYELKASLFNMLKKL